MFRFLTNIIGMTVITGLLFWIFLFLLPPPIVL